MSLWGSMYNPDVLLVFFRKWTRTHAWSINACLVSWLSVVWSVYVLFANWLSPWNRHFHGTHSCLSPVEIPYLQPLHAFGILIVSTPSCLQISSSKNPLALRILKSCLWFGMDIFWNRLFSVHKYSRTPVLVTRTLKGNEKQFKLA